MLQFLLVVTNLINDSRLLILSANFILSRDLIHDLILWRSHQHIDLNEPVGLEFEILAILRQDSGLRNILSSMNRKALPKLF